MSHAVNFPPGYVPILGPQLAWERAHLLANKAESKARNAEEPDIKALLDAHAEVMRSRATSERERLDAALAERAEWENQQTFTPDGS